MKTSYGLIGLVILAAGCGQKPPPVSNAPARGDYDDAPAQITFLDHADSNAAPDADLVTLEFTDREGQKKPLKDYLQGKNLVVVLTRGYTGSICPYCSTQVSSLIANHGQFEQQKAQIVVVYPVEQPDQTEKADEFTNRVIAMAQQTKELPFPILLDIELKGAEALGIRKNLSAKPATYILDPEGRLQFAYVGNTLADRPSVKALLEQLDNMNKLAAGS